MEKTTDYDAAEYSQFLFLAKFHNKSNLAENSQSLISRDSI